MIVNRKPEYMDESVIFSDAELWYKAKIFIETFNYQELPDNIAVFSGRDVIELDFEYLKNFVTHMNPDSLHIENAISNLKKLQERVRTKNQELANALKDFYPVCKKYYFNATLLPAFVQVLKKNGWLSDGKKKEKDKKEEKRQEERKQKEIHEPKYKKKPNPSSSPQSNKVLIFGIVLFFVVGSFVSYNFVYLPYQQDKDAPRYYTIVNTNLRSSRMAGTEFNRVTTLPYGSELIVYEQDNEWAYVKWGRTKGYIATSYILHRPDFFLLNSIFGNSESRECIETAKCRLALVDYFKRNHLFGKPYDEIPDEYAETEKNWQVFTKTKNAKPNTVFFPKLYDQNSKYTDFAFIIKQNETRDRRLVYYSFSEEETPVFRYEESAPETGYIKSMKVKGYNVETSYIQ